MHQNCPAAAAAGPGPIKLDDASLAGVAQPIVIARGRNLTLRSNDAQIQAGADNL